MPYTSEATGVHALLSPSTVQRYLTILFRIRSSLDASAAPSLARSTIEKEHFRLRSQWHFVPRRNRGSSPKRQANLLRVLEDGIFRPCRSRKDGSGRCPYHCSVRRVTRNPKHLRGRFREDLFYRLNVVTICPPYAEQRKHVAVGQNISQDTTVQSIGGE